MTGLFNSAPVQSTIQQVKPAAPMPDSNSPDVLEARRRAQLDIMGRAGRSSTILTAPTQRGGDYSSNSLGAGN